MEGIWEAAKAGDLAGVERLVDQDPGLLNGKNRSGMTPLTCASVNGVTWGWCDGCCARELSST
jgi:hypothetical protein